MSESNSKKNNYINRLKERYIYILIITIVMAFFGYFYKQSPFTDLAQQQEMKEYAVLDDEVKEYIKVSGKPTQIVLNVATNKDSKSATYNINILKDDKVISSAKVDTSELEESQNIILSLSGQNVVKGDELILQIQSDNTDVESALKVYLSENDNTILDINGEQTNETMCAQVTYKRFSNLYIITFIAIYLLACVMVLLWDMKSIHNSVFIFILIMGVISALFNPIMDIPDEPAHLARSELTSRGILLATGDPYQYTISKSVNSIIDNTFSVLRDSEFISSDGNFEYTGSYNNFASGNFFISYIPQALGILVGKLVGGSVAILFIGRIFNLIAYALMARYALKIAPRFKVAISTVAMMPLIIFISASFNQDATTYGLTLLLIGYLLKLYEDENIGIKEISIFSIITILLGLSKFPYFLLGFLILFLPKEKFKDMKTYRKSFILLAIVSIIVMSWGLGSVLLNSSSEGGKMTPFKIYFAENNVNSGEQIKYILSSPKTFIINFIKSIFDNSRVYLDEFNIFGWLTYGVNSPIMLLYEIFLVVTLLIYPGQRALKLKTRVGAGLALVGVYAAVNFIMFITWTTVGGSTVQGVQGRYFTALVALLPLISSKKFTIENSEKHDFNFQFMSIVFMLIYLVILMNRYY